MPKHLMTILVALLATFDISHSAKPERFSYKGINYQVVEIADVQGSEVTLLTDTGKEINVPARFLSFKLRDMVEKFVKEQEAQAFTIDGINSENAKKLQAALLQAAQEGTGIKRWIAGTVANNSPDEGLLIFSSSTALPLKHDRKGNPLPQQRVKNAAVFMDGLVFLEGSPRHAGNTLVEYFAWDSGKRIEINSERIPHLTLKPQSPRALFKERQWTNTQGKTLTAALLSINKDSGQFRRNDGSRFTYPLEKLTAKDRKLIETAIEERLHKLQSTL